MIRVRLFGEPEIRAEGAPISIRRTDSKLVLAYVYLYLTAHPRQHLAHVLWPDVPEAAAAARMRQALHWLAVDLTAGGYALDDVVATTRDSVERMPAVACRTDVDDLLDAVKEVGRANKAAGSPRAAVHVDDDVVATLERALAASSGELLQGLEASWIAAARSDVLRQRMEAMEWLAQHAAQRLDLARADAWTAEILSIEPGNPRALRLRRRLAVHRDGNAATARSLTPSRSLADPSVRPRQPETLVGREDVVASCVVAVRESQLTTLVGPPGVGKSAIASRVLALCAPTMPGDALIIDLADALGEDAAREAIARGLTAPDDSGGAGEWQARSHGPAGGDLIVLDNVDASQEVVRAFVLDSLGSGVDVRFVVTSRVPLGLEPERVVRVPPLAEHDARVLLGDIAPSGLRADIANAIVAAFDGLPLGIVHAAEAVHATSDEAVLARLEGRPDLLGGNRAMGRAPRHRNLATAIATSWHQLTPPEQALLVRLSLTDDPLGLDDVVAAAHDLGGAPVELLRRLVHHGLVEAEADPSVGARRYRVLRPIRAFARARAADGVEPS